MTLKSAIDWATPLLQKSCERPRFEAELLLAYHAKRERIYLYTHENEPLERVDKFKELIKRRAAFEPYEYIVGSVSFYDIDLSITQGVLIPRPETEMLIDEVVKVIESQGVERIIEIGVGSAAISIVLARRFPKLEIVATDISDIALELAQNNIDHFGLSDRIKLCKTNLMDGVEFDAQMVVSNPPYIADDFALEKNVSEYEPHTALFGGAIGDELLKQIINDVAKRNILWLACEMGYDQLNSMRNIFEEMEAKESHFYQDLAGLDRGFVVKL